LNVGYSKTIISPYPSPLLNQVGVLYQIKRGKSTLEKEKCEERLAPIHPEKVLERLNFMRS